MMQGPIVTFQWNGKQITGRLTSVSGAGSLYHLMVDNYYWGQLNFSPHFGWTFTSNTRDLNHMSEYFGEVVAIALESIS